MPEPTRLSVDDVGRALLRAALPAFAAVEGVDIPEQEKLAEFLYQRAVWPLLADVRTDPEWGGIPKRRKSRW